MDLFLRREDLSEGKKEDSGSGGRGREEVGEDDSPFSPSKKENKNTVVLRTHFYRIFQGR